MYFVNRPSSAELAAQSGDSKSTIFRFIRLTELVPPLLEMVDARKIAFNPAVELSYLTEQQQYDLCETIEAYDCTPSLSQAQRLKEAARAGNSFNACTFGLLRLASRPPALRLR